MNRIVEWFARTQHNLGIAHANGLGGIPQSATDAVEWFRLAAEQGHAAAQGNLGVAYSNGLGISRDATEAVVWYRLAADRGYAAAEFALGELQSIMTAEELEEAERLANEWKPTVREQ